MMLGRKVNNSRSNLIQLGLFVKLFLAERTTDVTENRELSNVRSGKVA